MIKFYNAKKTTWFVLVLAACFLAITFQGCKKRSEMGTILFKKTQNIVFKDFDPDTFAVVFKKVLASEKSNITNPQFILNHYDQNDFEPVFVINHLWDGSLQVAIDQYQKADEHGIDPKIFQPEQISALMQKFHSKDGIKTIGEAYHDMAELEILASNSLINYSGAMQFGILSPRKIYSRYFIKTLRPDTTSMNRIFNVEDMKAYLDSIQPKDPNYLVLQKAFQEGITAPGLSKEETRRILLVNMERLRWKNKPADNKYVYVNIPDYRLNVIDSGRSVLNMKVCVGEGRNKLNLNTLESYNDTCREDNPFPHETPLLSSVIHSVQVNPIWNIPKSIATKEIIVEEVKDPFYLSNKNIDVYKDGKLIEDPETIDWSKVTPRNSDYEFKQEPGADNSLGKIKFLFENRSSVYLHDTPAKDAFRYAMRAVSHGCVRLEQPLQLAHTLFRDTARYNLVAKIMSEDNPTPTDIALRPRVPVYITYVTCWPDKNGQLQFRKDVYGLDIVLYDHLKKFLLPE